jgi:hypothetical protein
MLRQIAFAALAATLVTPAAAQDYSLVPTFGVFSVQSGFLPDPNWISLLAGGNVRGEYTDRETGIRCAGYFADAPDFRVFFTPATRPCRSMSRRATTPFCWSNPRRRMALQRRFLGSQPGAHLRDPAGRTIRHLGRHLFRQQWRLPGGDARRNPVDPFAAAFERAFFGEDDRIAWTRPNPPGR